MVLFNYSTKEITAKIVYYGPGLCGKTTNLQFIYDDLPETINKGKMLSLATKTDRTLFFDFLPLDLGTIRGMRTRLQLYTVPGQVFYNTTRKLVLKGADGIIFVADSQKSMTEANIESFRNLEQNLREYGINLEEIPLVIQFNKRDLPDVTGIEELNAAVNKFNAPIYEAVASTGIGVHETLKACTRLVLNSLKSRYADERQKRGTMAAAAPANAARARAARSAATASSTPTAMEDPLGPPDAFKGPAAPPTGHETLQSPVASAASSGGEPSLGAGDPDLVPADGDFLESAGPRVDRRAPVGEEAPQFDLNPVSEPWDEAPAKARAGTTLPIGREEAAAARTGGHDDFFETTDAVSDDAPILELVEEDDDDVNDEILELVEDDAFEFGEERAPDPQSEEEAALDLEPAEDFDFEDREEPQDSEPTDWKSSMVPDEVTEEERATRHRAEVEVPVRLQSASLRGATEIRVPIRLSVGDRTLSLELKVSLEVDRDAQDEVVVS